MIAATCVSALAATLLTAPPPAPPAPPTPRDGEIAVRMVEHYAHTSRQRRLRHGALTTAFSVPQLGLGVYGLTSERFSPVMRRSAVAQTLFGVAGVSMGVHGLSSSSPLEQLARSPEYEALRVAPHDVGALRRVEVSWARHARKARTWRRIIGSGYVGGGVGLSVFAVLDSISQDEALTRAETFWAYATLGTGIGLILSGALDLVTPTPTERAYAAYTAAVDHPSRRRLRRPRRLWVSPTMGGVSVSGRF